MALQERPPIQGFSIPVEITEVPPPSLRVFENGIDLKMITDSRYFLYEDDCFNALVEMYPDKFTVGPHLIDYSLGHSMPFSADVRPDALIFDVGQNLSLSEIAEFKYGRGNGFRRKVDGFTRMTERMRENPGLLPILLGWGVDEKYTFPKIHIPPDSEIEISFINRYPHPEIEEIDSRIRNEAFNFKSVRYLTVPSSLPED